jgi:hypothetical protein
MESTLLSQTRTYGPRKTQLPIRRLISETGFQSRRAANQEIGAMIAKFSLAAARAEFPE